MWEWKGGVGSLAGNGGEKMGCGHGGGGLKRRVRASRRPRCLSKLSRANHSMPKMMGRNWTDPED